MFLEELHLIQQQIGQLDQEMATRLSQHQEAVERLAEVPGLGVDSAQQILAEVGASAATFASPKQLLFLGGSMSWRGTECRGIQEPPLPERQSPYAAPSQSGSQCSGQGQRNHFRDCLSPPGVAPGAQSNHRRDCPSSLSSHLDPPAPGLYVMRNEAPP